MPVSSPDAAELVKLLENIFRSVNIALVNELAMLCDRIGLDVWEVIDAAATKPYGFMRFTPGPGLGGHCIPIDPFYLSWRARQFDFQTEFIELAGKVNTCMPYFCAERVSQALNERAKAGARQQGAGAGRLLQAGRRRHARVACAEADRAAGELGAEISYHDPYVPDLRDEGLDLRSVDLDDGTVAAADIVCVVTAHSGIDYADLADRAQLVFDFRNVVPRMEGRVHTL